ncbi:MAG: 6-phosphofructokinase, partial [Clostridia bacterium]|nr:6-phosphofructokinase [Clostridia bacterium]
MKKFRRIGVLTSGGDAPGMNAAIRAVTREALARGVEVMAIYRGYSGLINGDVKPFSIRDVSNTMNHGGTMLYSDRCPEFKTEEGMKRAIETCRKFNIDGIVAIGGDGTFRGARDLTMHGIPCVGIPGTIDNDVTSTDFTIGFDTATNTVIELVDRLRDTCESHARCNVVEVMGRGAGDIALHSALATGATAVVIPEIKADEEYIIEKIRRSRALGKRNFIIIVSEGVGSDFSPAFAERIERETGVETRFARFAHVVRGGIPTLRDRLLASRMGQKAVEELFLGNSNIVICERKGKIIAQDIDYSLTIDQMYKNKLKENSLDGFTPAQIENMRAQCLARSEEVKSIYSSVDRL